jgi:hypothetical protein
MTSAPMHQSDRRPPWIRWVEWGLVAAFVGGIGGYLFWRPLNPMADPKAAHALALVQTHPARNAPSIRQAIDAIMHDNQKPGRSP